MVRSRMAIRRKHRPRSRAVTGRAARWRPGAWPSACSYPSWPMPARTRRSARPGWPDRLAPVMPGDLVPSELRRRRRDFGLPIDDHLVREARLVVGDPRDRGRSGRDRAEDDAEGAAPRTFRPSTAATRAIPLVGLRPTFDARLRRPGSLDAYRQSGHGLRRRRPGRRRRIELRADRRPTCRARERGAVRTAARRLSMTTKPSSAAASPRGGSAGATTAARAGRLDARPWRAPWRSPRPRRPRPTATPVEIAAAAEILARPQRASSTGNDHGGGHRATASGLRGLDRRGARSASEQRCLAEAIYFEARSEPEEGQAAVAQVVLNRVMSGLYPRIGLRRGVPEPAAPQRLPVLLRLRGPGPAHHRSASPGPGRPRRPRGDGGRGLCVRRRRLDPLPRQLRARRAGRARW